MIQRDPSWTGQWVADRICQRDDVKNVHLLRPQILQIARVDWEPFFAATLASAAVDRATVEGLATVGPEVDIFVNVPKESIWTGDAIAAVEENKAAFGGMADLHRAITEMTPSQYVNPEFGFVERGLRQHTNVSGLRRLYDRKYAIERPGLADVSVVLLNEYELTADHVRTARDRYGVFDSILITNPNGRSTGAADAAADSMGARIYKWGELLGRLNRT